MTGTFKRGRRPSHAARPAPVDGKGKVALALGLVHRRIGAGVDDHIGPHAGEHGGGVALGREVERVAPQSHNFKVRAGERLQGARDLPVAAGDDEPHGAAPATSPSRSPA